MSGGGEVMRRMSVRGSMPGGGYLEEVEGQEEYVRRRMRVRRRILR